MGEGGDTQSWGVESWLFLVLTISVGSRTVLKTWFKSCNN